MIYFVQMGDKRGPIKIGFTTSPPHLRMSYLQTGCPLKLRLLGSLPGTDAAERKLHRRFEKWWIRGEWFEPTDELMRLVKSASKRKVNESAPQKLKKAAPRNFGPGMSRVHVMLDKKIIAKVRMVAKARGESFSKTATDILDRHVSP